MMSTNNITTSSHDLFDQIRTMTGAEGESLFVGKDMATALGQQLAEVRHFLGFSLKGMPKMKDYLTWTPQGVDYLNRRLQGTTTGQPHAIQLNIFFNN